MFIICVGLLLLDEIDEDGSGIASADEVILAVGVSVSMYASESL